MLKLPGPYFDELAFGTRSRHGKAILLQAVDVKLDGLADKLEHFLAGLPHRHTARQVRDVGTPTRFASLNDHHVTHHRHPHFSFLRPACLSMAFNVPGGTSRLGLPTTVTVPGLLECLYCRWLPRVRASRHPSSARSRITSPTFTSPPVSFSSRPLTHDGWDPRPSGMWVANPD